MAEPASGVLAVVSIFKWSRNLFVILVRFPVWFDLEIYLNIEPEFVQAMVLGLVLQLVSWLVVVLGVDLASASFYCLRICCQLILPE